MKRNLLGAAACGCAVLLFIVSAGLSEEPDLQVNGIFKDGKGSVALVNDSIVKEGETIEGAEVLKITEEGVVFKYDNKEFLQRVARQAKGSSAPSLPASAGASSAATTQGPAVYNPASPKQSGPTKLKTIYGMDLQKMMQQGQAQTIKDMERVSRMQQPFNPANAQQIMQDAVDIKKESEAKKAETLRQMKEMEGE